MSQELLEYIKKCQTQGQSQSAIEANLLATGWTKEQIDQAFQQLVGTTGIIQPSYTPLFHPKPDPETKPKSKKLFLILGLAFILLLAVSSTSYYFLALKSEKSQPEPIQSTMTTTVTPSPTSSKETIQNDYVFVALQTYQTPNEKWTIYKVPLDGSGEKELWSKQWETDSLSMPFFPGEVSKDRKFITVPDGPNSLLKINIVTGEQEQRSKTSDEYEGYNLGNCVANVSDTKEICIKSKIGATPTIAENKYKYPNKLLVEIDKNKNTSTMLLDLTENFPVFDKYERITTFWWDEAKSSVLMTGHTGQGRDSVLMLNIQTKEIRVRDINENAKFSGGIYLPQLTKIVYGYYLEASIRSIDPESGEFKIIYENPDHYLNEGFFLSEDKKYLIFREDDYRTGIYNDIDPKDGEPTSEMVKLNLENGEVQKFDYPLDQIKKENYKLFTTRIGAWQKDLVIIRNYYIYGEEDEKTLITFDVYELKSKELRRIFSRSSDDLPDQEDFFVEMEDLKPV